MAHPSSELNSRLFLIDGTSQTATVTTDGRFFHTVVCLVAGNVVLTGDGDSSPKTIPMTAGQVVYGHFTSVANDSNSKLIAYQQ